MLQTEKYLTSRKLHKILFKTYFVKLFIQLNNSNCQKKLCTIYHLKLKCVGITHTFMDVIIHMQKKNIACM